MPLEGEPSPMRFAVYDMEWHPETLEVACVGVYDGKAFRIYKTVAEFLDKELTSERAGITYFAHAGGTYDIQFVLAELGLHGEGRFCTEASFSGSAAVIVQCKRGEEVYRFCDSFFLLRDSLANIGKALGIAKGDRDGAMDLIRAGRHHTPSGWKELADYNEQDNVILFRAIDRFQAEVLAMGGELRATLASCAMALFKRKFLHRTIRTSRRMNERSGAAYFASRVEVFRRQVLPKDVPTKYYDVNSSFPFSMTKPQPANFKNWGRHLPRGADALYLADLTVKVPAGMNVPPLPWRSRDQRIFFPTGEWRGLFDSADVELLEEAGGRILKVHSCTTFEPFSDLAEYVAFLYEMKRKASLEADDVSLSQEARADAKFRRLIYKLFLNSLYGKFAERSEKMKILVHPAYTRCPHKPEHEEGTCMRKIMPGVWECDEDVDVQHAHMPISVHVTALSRALLWRVLSPCKALYYCDTDSNVCDDDLETDPEERLGTLKLENHILEADFLAPKLYRMKKEGTCKHKGDEFHPDNECMRAVRSKGFSRLTWGEFGDLIDGREIRFTRMARMRENLRDGVLGVRMLNLHKASRGAFPKRADAGEGATRPYDVKELEAHYAPKAKRKKKEVRA